jgi:hypothetical protein
MVEQVAVLADRAGKDREVDLPVLIDGEHAHDGHGLRVAREQHAARRYP